MFLRNLQIISYSDDGKMIPVDLATEWGRRIIELLNENVDDDEEIKFCFLTTRADLIRPADSYQVFFPASDGSGSGTYGNVFYCVSLLSDRLIRIRIDYSKFFGTISYSVFAQVAILSSIDSIVIDIQEARYGKLYTCTVQTEKNTDLIFGYCAKYHKFLGHYIDILKNEIQAAKPIPLKKTDLISELERLSLLKEKGFINESEFNKAKNKLLG